MPQLNDDKPWVREIAVQQLGNFKDDAVAAVQADETIASDEVAYRVRAAALDALAQ